MQHVSGELETLSRLQRLYPGALGIGRVNGPHHALRAALAKAERRGELIPLRHLARLDSRTGQVSIPYVRMKTRAQVRRMQLIRIGSMSVGAAAFLAGFGWLAWESRYVIGAAAGLLAVIGLSVWLAPHWKRGCPGLHCTGCQG